MRRERSFIIVPHIKLLHAQKALESQHIAYIIFKLEHVTYACISEPLKIDRSELAKKGIINIKLGSNYSSLASGVQSWGEEAYTMQQQQYHISYCYHNIIRSDIRIKR
jgi:hypothetical protein